jgi:KipI family sensor histidine kinase inhibitor
VTVLHFGAKLCFRAFFLGDQALQLRAQNTARQLSTELAQDLASVATRLRGLAQISAVVPSFDSITLWLEPHYDADLLLHSIAALGANLSCNADELPAQATQIHTLKFRRDLLSAEFQLDLSEMARFAQCSESTWLRQFCDVRYYVACIGFKPGFPYLLGLPKALVMPRRASPRLQIPRGAVAVGGEFAGIYPNASPGGWHIVGVCDAVLFDPNRTTPCLLAVGDVVRFEIE